MFDIIRQILYLLYQHNEINEDNNNNEDLHCNNIISKTYLCHLPIKINKNLEHDTKSIISCNESFAEYAMKNEISQLLFKHGHEHKKRTLFIKKFSLIIKQCYPII